ncbi:MAG: recombinase family protein [Nitrospiraceae bacterium]|nr:recombinase family protein [Nitrospiraceae bacterium]
MVPTYHVTKTKRGMKMKKAVGYIRVSTTEQATEGISLDNQKSKIAAYCALNDLELIEIIEDAGKSGKNLSRDGVQALMSMVKGKRIDAVVVYKLDRLSRKVIDTLTLIETIERAGVTFHSLNEKIDTSTAMGRFFLNITASLAQMERDLISERTKDALQMKIANHERAGQIPFGWRLADDGNTLIPHEAQQEVIAQVKMLHSQGMSYRAICEALTKAGHRPQGKAWQPKTIGRIIKKAA